MIGNVVVIGLLLFANPGRAQAAPQQKLIGYLPEYRLDGFEIERLSGLTDLVFFSVTLPANGELSRDLISPAHSSQLATIRKRFRGRMLVTVGGWNRSAGFPKMTATKAHRSVLIQKLKEVCRQNKFGGIDFDWEHPNGGTELANYADLVRETKAAFRSFGGIVTVAQAAWQDLGREVYMHADRIHLMAYDHAFPQATYAKSKADVERLIGFGCPVSKIALGLPFYGRNRERVARTYAEIVARHRVPESDIADGYACNGPGTIKAKIAFARQRRLAGIMIWEIGQDGRGRKALLPTIVREISQPAQ